MGQHSALATALGAIVALGARGATSRAASAEVLCSTAAKEDMCTQAIGHENTGDKAEAFLRLSVLLLKRSSHRLQQERMDP